MAQYTCNNALAIDLMPALAKARLPFSVLWPRPDLAIFEGPESLIKYIVAEANHLNIMEKPTDKWGIWDDMTFPLSSPFDLREGFEPTSNLNMWEDATHQITFDEGKHWTNVKLDDSDPPYFVACSDGKTAWPVAGLAPYRVVKRPIAPLTREQEATVNEILCSRDGHKLPPSQHPSVEDFAFGLTHGRTVVGMADGRVEYRDNERTLGGPINVHPLGQRIPVAFSDPVHQERYDRGVCVECGNEPGPCRLCGGHVNSYEGVKPVRQAASVGESPVCGFLDTEFDSDPSVVGE